MKIIEERVERLKELSKNIHSLSNYQASQGSRDIAERNLQVAIEACLDIGKIIISLEGLKEPKDNKAIFAVLAETGILSEKASPFWFLWQGQETFFFMVMIESKIVLSMGF